MLLNLHLIMARIRVSLSVVKPRRNINTRLGQQNPEFEILVEDSGIGIPKK